MVIGAVESGENHVCNGGILYENACGFMCVSVRVCVGKTVGFFTHALAFVVVEPTVCGSSLTSDQQATPRLFTSFAHAASTVVLGI